MRHLRIRVGHVSSKHTFSVSRIETRTIVQVLTGKQPSFGDEGKIIGDIAQPTHLPDPNEWLSGDVWDLISRCWSASPNERPCPDTVTNTLNDAGDSVELKRRGFGEAEAELICFLKGCRDGPNSDQDVKKVKAQWFADVLDSVRRLWNQVSQVA